jgi:hypothetical protein
MRIQSVFEAFAARAPRSCDSKTRTDYFTDFICGCVRHDGSILAVFRTHIESMRRARHVESAKFRA